MGQKPLASTQSVCISGLGSRNFDSFLTGLGRAHEIFKDHLPPSALAALTTRQERGFPSLFFSNRYFTHAQDMKVQDVVPISPDIDPLGILAWVEGAIYTSDNEVQYFERIGKEGKM